MRDLCEQTGLTVPQVRQQLDALRGQGHQIEFDCPRYRIPDIPPLNQRVHVHLWFYGPMSVSQLTDVLGTPPNCIHHAVKQLKRKGVKVETHKRPSGVTYKVKSPLPSDYVRY